MDEPVDDLERRLNRLAPPVDVDVALAGVHTASRRRQVRQRGLAAAALLAVVVVLASTVVLTRGAGDDVDVVASQPDSDRVVRDGPGTTGVGRSGTSVAPDDPAPEPSAPDGTTAPDPSSGPASTIGSPSTIGAEVVDPDPSSPPIEQPTAGPLGRPDELDLVITPEQPTVRVGERLRFRVDVTNRSSNRALFHSGGCGPIEATASGPNGQAGVSAVLWDGLVPFGTFTQTQDLAARPYPTSPHVGSGEQACTADLRSDPLAPGATVSRSYVFDAVVVPGRAGAPAPVSITAGVDVILGPGIFGPVERRTASVVVAVTDDPRAHVSPSAFLAQVESNPTFQQWLQIHPPIASTVLYAVTLSYVNGGFELFVDNRNTKVRVRGDVTTGAITEVRSVPGNRAPDDDPDAVRYGPPDEILFAG